MTPVIAADKRFRVSHAGAGLYAIVEIEAGRQAARPLVVEIRAFTWAQMEMASASQPPRK